MPFAIYGLSLCCLQQRLLSSNPYGIVGIFLILIPQCSVLICIYIHLNFYFFWLAANISFLLFILNLIEFNYWKIWSNIFLIFEKLFILFKFFILFVSKYIPNNVLFYICLWTFTGFVLLIIYFFDIDTNITPYISYYFILSFIVLQCEEYWVCRQYLDLNLYLSEYRWIIYCLLILRFLYCTLVFMEVDLTGLWESFLEIYMVEMSKEGSGFYPLDLYVLNTTYSELLINFRKPPKILVNPLSEACLPWGGGPGGNGPSGPGSAELAKSLLIPEEFRTRNNNKHVQALNSAILRLESATAREIELNNKLFITQSEWRTFMDNSEITAKEYNGANLDGERAYLNCPDKVSIWEATCRFNQAKARYSQIRDIADYNLFRKPVYWADPQVLQNAAQDK